MARADTVVPKLGLTQWLEHPLVREAQRGLSDDSSPIDLLVNLYNVLTELDERFPGIPYRTILGAPTEPNKAKVIALMKEAGVSSEDICLATAQCGFDGALDESIFPMVRDQKPMQAWIDEGHTPGRARELMRLHKPLSEKEQRAWKLIEEGYTHGEVRRRTGLSRPTIRSAGRKIQYQLWLAAQHVCTTGILGVQSSTVLTGSLGVV